MAKDCPRVANLRFGTVLCGIVVLDLPKQYQEEIEAENER
jgi:hypothetical protein